MPLKSHSCWLVRSSISPACLIPAVSTIYLIGFQFSKQLAAIFLSTFAGHLYDRMGFQNTYLVLGGIVLAVTVLSAFTLSSTRKTAAPSAETATAQTEVRL